MEYHISICPFYLIQMLRGRAQLFLTNPRNRECFPVLNTDLSIANSADIDVCTRSSLYAKFTFMGNWALLGKQANFNFTHLVW